MFSSPRANLIECDEGFSVQGTGLSSLLYPEGDRAIKVETELLMGRGVAVYHRRMTRWESPHENEPVTDADRKRIAKNVQRALEFKGRDARLEPPLGDD
jgi:hypothetical protein